jgi:hypothetical protein
MASWRMAMKVGSGGTSLWPECLSRGIAAITYEPLSRTDLSKYRKASLENYGRSCAPTSHGVFVRLPMR